MRRTLLFVAVAVLAAGCSLGDILNAPDDSRWADLSGPELVGVWQGDHGHRFEFTADGEFYGKDLDYLFAGDDMRDAVDMTQGAGMASGRWQLARPLSDGRHSFGEVTFDVVANQPVAISLSTFLAINTDQGLRLSVDMGRQSPGVFESFAKCGDCPPVAPGRPKPGKLTAATDLAGTWRDQHRTALVLRPDGTFTAEDVRWAYVATGRLLPYNVTETDPITATGTWKTSPPQHDPNGAATSVVLAFKTVAGKPSFGVRSLLIYQSGKELVLATLSTDPEVLEQHLFIAHERP
ncbi:hypothetical protein [Hamadaea tsunoensis]|uniref:hypothetical protein n=1 Tax=Hamadaea tsunoensis TaxID=53368 RepID=UPI0004282096|nr:hypothetical protein [Hamadaea tsunoensis]